MVEPKQVFADSSPLIHTTQHCRGQTPWRVNSCKC